MLSICCENRCVLWLDRTCEHEFKVPTYTKKSKTTRTCSHIRLAFAISSCTFSAFYICKHLESSISEHLYLKRTIGTRRKICFVEHYLVLGLISLSCLWFVIKEQRLSSQTKWFINKLMLRILGEILESDFKTR